MKNSDKNYHFKRMEGQTCPKWPLQNSSIEKNNSNKQIEKISQERNEMKTVFHLKGEVTMDDRPYIKIEQRTP